MKKLTHYFILMTSLVFLAAPSRAETVINDISFDMPIPNKMTPDKAVKNKVTHKKIIKKPAKNGDLDKIFIGKKTVAESSKSKETAAIFYQKSNIIITRKQLSQDAQLLLNIEVRDGESLYKQNGWFNLSSYVDKAGVLMAFSTPDKHPITSLAQYAPVDILFIDKQGKILQIAPSISLSELDQEIYPESPILAFLFLKGGSCSELSINVGDEIQYSLFKKPPLILNAPPPVLQPVVQPAVQPISQQINQTIVQPTFQQISSPVAVVNQPQKPVEIIPENSPEKLNQFLR